jgi:hypothetical protein
MGVDEQRKRFVSFHAKTCENFIKNIFESDESFPTLGWENY